MKTGIERVMGSVLYNSGDPFKSEAIQRLTRGNNIECEALIQDMLDRGLIKQVADNGKVRESAKYAKYNRARDLAMHKPWR